MNYCYGYDPCRNRPIGISILSLTYLDLDVSRHLAEPICSCDVRPPMTTVLQCDKRTSKSSAKISGGRAECESLGKASDRKQQGVGKRVGWMGNFENELVGEIIEPLNPLKSPIYTARGFCFRPGYDHNTGIVLIKLLAAFPRRARSRRHFSPPTPPRSAANVTYFVKIQLKRARTRRRLWAVQTNPFTPSRVQIKRMAGGRHIISSHPVCALQKKRGERKSENRFLSHLNSAVHRHSVPLNPPKVFRKYVKKYCKRFSFKFAVRGV